MRCIFYLLFEFECHHFGPEIFHINGRIFIYVNPVPVNDIVLNNNSIDHKQYLNNKKCTNIDLMFKRYWSLFFVLLIEGASLMAVELMGAKLIAPFYGGSLYVWTAVLAITVLGLTIGYFSGGLLSKNKHPERLLSSTLAIASVLVLLLPYSATFIISFTSFLALIPGACIACSLLLLPPMICFGILGPMVVRLMANTDEIGGDSAGTVYFISTIGGIVATFLFGYYMIPVAGLKFSSLITSGTLAVSCIIYVATLLSAKNKVRVSEPEQNTVKNDTDKKSKTIVAVNKDIRSSVYLFAILEGASVMAIELISSRMLAPYFGSSLFVWSAVIGFTLLGLALGYYFGGTLQVKYPAMKALACILLLASVFLILMHIISEHTITAFTGVDMNVAVIIVCTIIIVPPLLFLGMVPTLLIRHISASASDAGRTAGNIFALSSVSGIIALLVMGFYIIPEYGLTMPSIIIGVIVGAYPVISYVKQKKYIVLLWLLLIPLTLSVKYTAVSKDVDVKYFSEGLLGQILVADISNTIDNKPRTDRILFVNRIGQSFFDAKTGASTSDYLIYVSSVVSKMPANSKVLLIGLGGGSIVNILHKGLGHQVDVVELDERIADVAHEYFYLDKDISVIVDDGRHYLETTEKKYDLIFFDAFKGDFTPAHLYTLESFRKARSLLNKNGMIIVNYFGIINGKAGTAGRSVYKTLSATGLNTRILPTIGEEESRNLLLVAGNGDMHFNDLKYPLKLSDKVVDMDTLFLDPNRLDMKNASILTDDRPILERTSFEPAMVWRKWYNNNLSKTFIKNGISYYK